MRLIDEDATCREVARKRNNGEIDFSPEIELMLIDIIMEQPTAWDLHTHYKRAATSIVATNRY